MKKIAFIIPDLYNRGMPRVLESLENNISKNEYDKYIILLKRKPIKFHVKGKIIELEDEGKSFLSKIYIFIKRLIKLYNINRKYKFDYVISFGMTANILAIITFRHGKVIITEHNVKSIENNLSKDIKMLIYNKIYNFFIRILYNKADFIVSVSKYIGLDLIKNYGIKKEKIYTIYNGVDKNIIDKLKYEPLSDSEYKIFKNPVILNVGALSFQKGQWYLIKIMPELKKKIPNLQLVILGQGSYYDKLSNLIQSLNLQDSVHLIGEKSNPYKYMYNADIFVLTSLYEGFPNVLVEAMSVELPIVSVDCKSGPRELLNENINIDIEDRYILCDYGILVPDLFKINVFNLEKKQILLQAILEIMENNKLREYYRQKSRYRIKNFTAEKMTEQYINILKNIK